MFGRKLYVCILVTMSLLAAFGLWVAIDGAAAWKERPRIQESLPFWQQDVQDVYYLPGGTLG